MRPERSTVMAQGVAHFGRQEWVPALACFNQVLTDGVDATALNYRARILTSLDRCDEALADVDQCLTLDGRNVAELRNRAILLRRLGRDEEALQTLDATLTLAPHHVEVLGIRAYLLLKMGRVEEGRESAASALSLDHKDIEARRAYALALELLGQDESALRYLEEVAVDSPHYIEALNDCGRLTVRLGQFDKAVTYYDRSLAQRPDPEVTRYNHCMALLLSGDWQRGFERYEVRWHIAPPEAKKILSLGKLWLGKEDVRGKHVLLHHEQGYGDTLQFARYASALMDRGARVTLAVPAALRTLMGSLKGYPDIISEGDPVPPHDYLCPLMSLPLAFKTTPANVPGSTPYLQATARQVLDWSLRLGKRTRMRIGLVWCGRREPPINHPRDIALELLEPLLALPADLITLQKEVSQIDRQILERYPHVQRYGEEVHDFADTAALIEHLDLVIAVDSAVAHLAGALGKPVWLLNRFASCWRWLPRGARTTWYPTMRIFRQPRFGDWRSVIQTVREAALNLLGKPEPSVRVTASEPKESAVKTLHQAMMDHAEGRLAEALKGYQQLCLDRPASAPLLQRMGVAHAGLKQWLQAEDCLRRSLQLDPADAGAHSNLGNVYLEQRRHEAAIGCYQQATALKADFSQAHLNLAIALNSLKRYSDALQAVDRALQYEPNNVTALTTRADSLAALTRWTEAYDGYTRALTLEPNHLPALINRATSARRLNHYSEALNDSQRALELDSTVPESHCNRGAALAGVGQYDAALESYDKALALKADYPEAQWNKSLVLLTQGRLLEGWTLYENRWRVRQLGQKHPFPESTRWTGQEPLNGITLLLHAEQGYGDTIQFCRYASLAAQRGARVVVQAPASLTALLRSLPGVEAVIDQEQPLPPYDLHCPMLSLPLAFGTDLSSIPAPAVYLQADKKLARLWARWLGTRKRPRIGIAWAGKPTHSNDIRRSLPLSQLYPLFDLPADFICLHKELSEIDRNALMDLPNIRAPLFELADFSQTAALISELDLVITVDTAVAHLAGALDKPLWLMLPFVADWRWMRGRYDSPWYPNARLFRQPSLDEWEIVVSNVQLQLGSATETHYFRSKPRGHPDRSRHRSSSSRSTPGL